MSRKKFTRAFRGARPRIRPTENQTFRVSSVLNIPRCLGALALAPLLLPAAFLSSGCAKKAKPPAAMSPRVGSAETGIASWYGYPYHGRRAANGEIYDMERLTAAHRTLPFETFVEVLNLTNRKTVTVRITDRGPFIEGRIIDLSRAAANAIDLIGPGIAQVRITVVAPPPEAAQRAANFAVQVGAFRDRERAERLRAEYERSYGAARLLYRAGDPPVWRVLVGREDSIERANALLERILERSGQPAFVVRMDDSDSAMRANP